MGKNREKSGFREPEQFIRNCIVLLDSRLQPVNKLDEEIVSILESAQFMSLLNSEMESGRSEIGFHFENVIVKGQRLSEEKGRKDIPYVLLSIVFLTSEFQDLAAMEEYCNAFPDHVLLLSGDGVILDAKSNPFVKSHPKLTSSELTGKSIFEFLSGIALQEMKRSLKDISKVKGARDVVLHQGEAPLEQYLETRLRCLSNGGILVFMRDVTLQALEEQNLELREEKYRKIIEDQSELICRYTPDGILTFVNEAYCRYFGKSREELIGKGFEGFISKADGERISALSGNVTPETPAFRVTHQVYLPDGRVRWHSWTNRGLFDSNNQVREFQGVGSDVTERIEAEHALIESEERFRQMAESIDQVFWIYDLERKCYTYISPGFSRHWGIDPHRFLGESDGWASCIVNVYEKEYKDALASGFRRKHEIVYQIVRSDGAVRWIRDRGFPASFRKGEKLLYGVAEDITASKEAEHRMHLSEERLALALEGTEGGVWDWKCNTGELVVSDQWLRIIGYTRDEFPGNADWYFERVHPEDIDLLNEKIKEHLEGKTQTYSCEHRMKRPDGTWHWVEGRGKIVEVAEDGSPTRFVGTNTDISQRKRAEEDLRISEERLQLALSASEDGLWDWDISSNKIYFNSFWMKMIGLNTKEFIYTIDQWRGSLHPQDQELAERRLRALLTMESDTVRFEYRIKISSGEWRWIETVAKIVEVERDQPARVIATHKDIQASKMSEEILKDAKRNAEEAAEAKSEFLATMSHELRTPLNGILGMISVLNETQLSKEQHEFLKIAHASGENLLSLINDLLDFSRIEARGIELENSIVDVHDLVMSLVESLSKSAQEKELEINISFRPGTPRRVMGDLGRLRQIFLNLINNAIKFTHEGYVYIVVRGDFEGDRRGLSFQVIDTGEGIQEKDLKTLFDPFKQGIRDRVERPEGTGLGLAIVKRLVELMGGYIDIETKRGSGTTFTIRLPLDNSGGEVFCPLETEKKYFLISSVGTMHDSMKCFLGKSLEIINLPDAGDAAGLGSFTEDLREKARDGHQLLIDVPTSNKVRQALEHPLEKVFEVWPDNFITLLLPYYPRSLRDHYLKFTTARVLSKPFRRQLFLERLEEGKTMAQSMNVSTTKADTSADKLPSLEVLVVEDNVVNQKVALLLLQKMGHRVEVANDGFEALVNLERKRYDVVLMDCMMPKMDGYEATRAIRTSGKRFQNIPIIAMTAYAMKGDKERCLEAGMDSYLQKPVDPKRLKSLLDEVIQLNKGIVSVRKEEKGDEAQSEKGSHHSRLDYSVLLNSASGDKEFMLELLSMIKADIKQRVPKLKRKLNAGDMAGARVEAHTLKGHSLHIGAKRFSELTLDAQRACEEDERDTLNDLFSKIEAEAEVLLQRISEDYPEI